MRNKIGFLKIAVLTTILAFFSCTTPDDVKHYPPQKPQELSAIVNNPNEVDLFWEKDTSAQDAAKYYRVYKSTQPSSEYSVAAQAVYGNQTTIRGLLPSTKYYFKLTAINDYGESDTTDAVSEKTLIGTPQNLKTTLLPNNNLILEWDKVADNEKNLRNNGGNNENDDDVKYKVYLSLSDNFFEEYSFAGETGETRMKFANLDNEKTHYFKVSAVDNQGREGAKSLYVSVSVSGALPLAPQGLLAELKIDEQDNGKISARLLWNSVSGADGYRVYYSTQPQVSYQYYAPMLDNFTVVNGLKAGETYFFKVSAVNKNGEGAKSQEAFVQTPAPTAPNTPTGLSAEGIAKDTILIRWNSVSTATQYFVHYSASPTGAYQKIGPYTGNSLRLYGMSAGSTRYFKISASNAYGESPLSSYVSATTKTY